ncbi:Het-C domain-containing protein [Aspergillus clavatus NRRL 1]|uniref:NIMA-interacting protein TinC n=1 Tax=Aspergillus clavatus (strain ATCC 1007 / CBS 513.65 / DSM 816 / NCTC 3887 / NRRL 1 / QM 1276 / 107) TaxID=344612 RepID=A1CFY6_ASPCL|nr:NIMA-interacting protein TinC [Aspergillus clavatus NRRL 1]EAW10866.1 NIMA-interacting protein TinC [Aspergillus clavatus NRRL 1]
MRVSFQNFGISILLVLLLSGKVHAFGAGNIASISRVEGQNWRHGDIEDTLLTLFLARVAGGRKFSKLDVQRVYFGNWLRDYSQAVDVGTLKYVSTEAIRILIWVLGFLSFGYGTKEFEVTTERLGCYEPTEHIDNPLGYADGEDARRYDSRLRGPIDEERELSIDPSTGLKNYIANENIGIGRRYARSRNDEDLHEALRLLGTGLHCLEDYAAHSNYTELSLIELGESIIFPHVGRNTKLEVNSVQDYVYPIVTGTFGGVDFFHSVLGELSDKTTQSEVQCLEGVINESQNGTPSQSFIQDLLSKIPEGLIGDRDNQAGKMDEFKTKAEDAKAHNQEISPREPEEWTRYLDDVHRQVYPVLEWHDNLIKSINRAIEKIPVLPELIDQFQEQINVFVFAVLAPYILPIITQVKTELQTGSSEIIQSSQAQQHIVFDDDDSSNPTHSMLSKDHFSNVLNEPAGRIASQVVKWTVPQLMECWDNEDIDVDRTIDRIVTGVFHHPALRQYGEDGASDARRIMFGTVEEWWSGKDEAEKESLREQLSRDGVFEGKNHKEGVHDSGHGCGKPLTLHRGQSQPNNGYNSDTSGLGRIASEAAGGGSLGGLVGRLASQVGSMLQGDSGSRKPDNGGYETRYDDAEPTEQYQGDWRRFGGETEGESQYSEVDRYQRKQWQEGADDTPSYTRREGGEERKEWQDKSEEQFRYDITVVLKTPTHLKDILPRGERKRTVPTNRELTDLDLAMMTTRGSKEEEPRTRIDLRAGFEARTPSQTTIMTTITLLMAENHTIAADLTGKWSIYPACAF